MRSMWLCQEVQPQVGAVAQRLMTRPTKTPPHRRFRRYARAAESDTDVSNGTVARARATCVCCKAVLPPERVRSQLAAQKGGADTVFDDAGNGA